MLNTIRLPCVSEKMRSKTISSNTLATQLLLKNHQVDNLPVTRVQPHHLPHVLHQVAHDIPVNIALEVQKIVRPENKCSKLNIYKIRTFSPLLDT